MDELTKLQGQRLKEIRKILGLSQNKFCDWLAQHDILGNYEEKYKPKTIQSWEQGIRKVPDDVKKALSDNVTCDGYPIQYAYLNGDTDFKTQSVNAIVESVFKSHSAFISGGEWTHATASDIQEIANAPLNKFGLVFLNDVLPIYNHTKNDFFDIMRFNKYMYEEIGKLIEEYLQNEIQGR